MKTKSANERVSKLSLEHRRLRTAFWLLLGYVVLLSVVVYGVQSGLWMANDAVWEVLSIR